MPATARRGSGRTSWRHPLSLERGHPIIQTNGLRYLIDTGSPVSISERPVRLGDREFVPSQSLAMGMTVESISRMAGIEFDTLIGMDILGEFDCEMSLLGGTFTLCSDLLEIPRDHGAEFFESVPIVTCQIAGQPVRCFLDTGAPLSYLSQSVAADWPEADEVEDFHPLFGKFRVATHLIEIQLGAANMKIRTGVMPTLLRTAFALASVQGILGTAVLARGQLRFSNRRNLVAFQPH